MRITATVEGMGKLNEILSPNYFREDVDKIISEFSTELHQELVDSSPVDKGEYQQGWELPKKINDYEYLIQNRVEHAGYLVYGLERWKGAGFPTKQPYVYPNKPQGMIHDVRKLIFKKMKEFDREA